jgi:hypothetical protein
VGSGKAPIIRRKRGGAWAKSGSANPGLQVAQGDIYECKGGVRARMWMDYDVKIVRRERKRRKEKRVGPANNSRRDVKNEAKDEIGAPGILQYKV